MPTKQNNLVSFFKNISGDIVAVDRDGNTVTFDNWHQDEISAARKCTGVTFISNIKPEVVYSFDDHDDVPHDGNGEGDAEYGGAPDQGEDQGGSGESEADADDESQGESQGDGESEQGDDQGELDFSKCDTSGEGDPIEESKLADDLWQYFKPRVVEIAEHRAGYAYAMARRADRVGGTGGGIPGNNPVKVSGKVTGEVPTLRHHKFDKLLSAVARGLHVYLPGPPGTGKSFMIQQVAKALGREFHIDSFSPMSTESKLFGFVDAHGKVVETGFRRSFVGGLIYGGDELDNSNPAIVTGLNSALANGLAAFPDGTYEMHPDFVMIATANTLGTGPTAEFAGRQKLDPATLNRFVKIYIDTDESVETAIVESILGSAQASKWLAKVRHVRRAVEAERIKHFVTMRDSINGAKLIAKGDGAFTVAEALEMTCMGTLTEEQQHKVKVWRG